MIIVGVNWGANAGLNNAVAGLVWGGLRIETWPRKRTISQVPFHYDLKGVKSPRDSSVSPPCIVYSWRRSSPTISPLLLLFKLNK